MPAPADEPLTRCNLNLFTADKEWLEKRFGRGWTEQVRKLVHDFRKERQMEAMTSILPRTFYDK